MVTRLEFCLGQLLPPFPGGLWMASQHHKGIQRLLVLLDELPVYSVLCLGPLLNLWERFNCTGPRLPLGTPPQKKKPWVSFIVNNGMYCVDFFIQKQPHPLCFLPRHDVCMSSCWSDFHIESLFQNFTLTSEIWFLWKRKILLKAPPLCQEWQSTGNLMYWFLFQGDLGLRGKDAGEEKWWANEGFRERNGRGWGIGIYVFTSCPDFVVYGELDWTNIPLRFTICPFRDAQVTLNWKGKKFNWYLDDTSLGTRIDFA